MMLMMVSLVSAENRTFEEIRADVNEIQFWGTFWDELVNDELNCNNYPSIKKCLDSKWKNTKDVFYKEHGWDNTTTLLKFEDVSENIQMGVEDFAYKIEKELITNNANRMWDYNHLIMVIVWELIKLAIYMGLFAILVYILIDAIPNIFIKMKDSIVEMYFKWK